MAFKNVLRNFGFVVAFSLVGTGVVAQTLPSNSYDDYDSEKYTQIAQGRQSDLDRATEQYQRAEQYLRNALDQETRLKREYEQLTREFQDNKARELEITRAIQQSNQNRANLTAQIQAATNEIAALNQAIADANASVTRLKSMADGLQADTNAKKTAMDAAVADTTAKKKAAADAEAALNAQNALIEQINKELAAAPAEQKAAVQAKLDAELAKLPGLMSTRTAAQQAASAAQSVSDAKTNEYNTAKARSDAANTELSQAQTRATQAQNALNAKNQQIQKLNTDLANETKRGQELQTGLQQAQQRQAEIGRYLQGLDHRIRQAMAETRQRTYERDQAQAFYGSALAARDEAYNRMNIVNGNIENARVAIQDVAGREGAIDGDREGRELGQARGSVAGETQGAAEGRDEGTREGQAREYADGANRGKQNAAATPPVNGNPDGTGAGLGYAYKMGRQEGFAHGDVNGTDKVAYGKGRARGEADGLAQAKTDALPQEGVGYKRRENDYLTAPLKKVDLGGENNLAAQFKGVQGRYSNNGDDRYYSPRPGNYPHPRLTRFYSEAYDSSYRDTLERTYQAIRQAAFDAARQAAHDREKAAALAKTYEESRSQGFTDYTKGFADGNADASQKKGYREGKKAAYDANIQKEKDLADARGVARANELYTKNAVLQVVSIQLIDSDRDGIIRPGETVQTIAIVKNFGLVSKQNLQSEASVLNGSASVKEGISNVPVLPPQSEATILGRAQIAVNAQADDGSAIQLKYRLIDANGEAGREVFNRTVQFPTVTSIQNFDGILIPGARTEVKIALRNRSQSKQSLTVEMSVDNSKVQIEQNVQRVSDLNAGETKTVTFALTGRPEARFEETPIRVSVTQNGLAFGKTGMNGTIIQRHKPSADSIGLIVSKNLAQGGGKALYRLSKLDTWDLRVDGAMSAQNLGAYSEKVVHLLGDVGASLDGSTAQALSSFVQNGGQLVIWGSDLDQSQVLSQLSGVAAVSAGRADNVNESLAGQAILNGFQMSARSAAALRAGNIKVRTVLSSSRLGAVGTATFGNGYADKVGHVFVLGVNTSDLDSNGLQALTNGIRTMAMGFDQKKDLAQRDVRYMPYLVMDIQNEMLMAELDGSQNYYREHKEDSKMYRALVKFLKDSDKKSEARKQFSSLYPMVRSILDRMKNNQWTVDQLVHRTMGFLGPNWKSDFCRVVNNNHQYCQENNFGNANN
jgi:predicted  nucleic acid-binding Zn-ribbon protein